MNNRSSKKTWFISLGIIVAAILAYYVFFSGSPAPSGGLLQADTSGEIVGAQVLTLLNQIQSLQIDNAFFRNPAYLSLQDYTVAIPPVNVGRPNPFAPLPGIRSAAPPR